jgi:RNA-directed DNA polymerase
MTDVRMTNKIEQVNHPERNLNWGFIPWKKVNSKSVALIKSKAFYEVVSLRQRIFSAKKLGNLKTLRSLQKLLLSSKYNILFFSRKITSINKGKSTPKKLCFL